MTLVGEDAIRDRGGKELPLIPAALADPKVMSHNAGHAVISSFHA